MMISTRRWHIFVNQRESSCCLGFIMDILLQLKDDLDIELNIYEVEDCLWGVETNGSWSGLIGEAKCGRTDVAAHFTTITTERQRAVDFTESSQEENLVLVALHQYIPLSYSNSEAFAALFVQSWILILAVAIFTDVIIYSTTFLAFKLRLCSSNSHICVGTSFSKRHWRNYSQKIR